MGVKFKTKFSRNAARIRDLENRKGKFILASNCMDPGEISGPDVLQAYRDRNRCIEGNFRFLKRKDLGLSQMHLKKEVRIAAALAVMTRIIFTNNLAQLRLREHLDSMRITFFRTFENDRLNSVSA